MIGIHFQNSLFSRGKHHAPRSVLRHYRHLSRCQRGHHRLRRIGRHVKFRTQHGHRLPFRLDNKRSQRIPNNIKKRFSRDTYFPFPLGKFLRILQPAIRIQPYHGTVTKYHTVQTGSPGIRNLVINKHILFLHVLSPLFIVHHLTATDRHLYTILLLKLNLVTPQIMMFPVSKFQYRRTCRRTDISNLVTVLVNRKTFPQQNRRHEYPDHGRCRHPVPPPEHPMASPPDSLPYGRIISLDQPGSNNFPHNKIFFPNSIKQPTVLIASLPPRQNLPLFRDRKFAVKIIQ